MEITSTTSSQILPEFPLGPLDEAKNGNSNDAGGTSNTTSTGAPAPAETGDAVALSDDALAMSQESPNPAAANAMATAMTYNASAMLAAQNEGGSIIDPMDQTTFTNTKFSTKLGNDLVGFDNRLGVVSWNGQNLNLTGIANTMADDIRIQSDGSQIYVYKGSDIFMLDLNGQQSSETSTRAWDADQGGFYLYNSATATGSDKNNVIVSRASGATITGGAGDDKIFNFSNSATIQGGDGKDNVYTVGLSSGSIDTGDGDGYIKISSNMTGGSITMGAGRNTIDATGLSLSGVTITDTNSTSSTLIAASVTGGSISFSATDSGIRVGSLNSNVTFGAGTNTLIAKNTGTVTITSTGDNLFDLTNVTNTTIDSSGSSGDTVKIPPAKPGAWPVSRSKRL